MGSKGTAIEAVETKTRVAFTMAQLYTLAARYYLSKEWVKNVLKYVDDRTWVAEQLRHDLPDDKIEVEGLPRRLYIENCVEEELKDLRFERALDFSGAMWLELDEDSEKHLHTKNRCLVVLQGGRSCVGVILPPRTVMQIKHDRSGAEKMIPRPNTKKVEFTLHRWEKRGSFPRNVFFEGDDVRKEEGVPLKTPIGELCSRLSVNVEDLERTISNMVLRTEEDWHAMKFEAPHFIIGRTAPAETRNRLLEHGFGVDEVVKAKSA